MWAFFRFSSSRRPVVKPANHVNRTVQQSDRLLQQKLVQKVKFEAAHLSPHTSFLRISHRTLVFVNPSSLQPLIIITTSFLMMTLVLFRLA